MRETEKVRELAATYAICRSRLVLADTAVEHKRSLRKLREARDLLFAELDRIDALIAELREGSTCHD